MVVVRVDHVVYVVARVVDGVLHLLIASFCRNCFVCWSVVVLVTALTSFDIL